MPKILIFNPMDLRWMNNVANYFVLRCKIFGLKIRRYKSILSVTTITNSIKTLTPPSSPKVHFIDTTNCKTQSDLSSRLAPPSSKKKKKKKSSLLFLETTSSKNSTALAWKGCRRRTVDRANTQNYCKIRKAKFSVYLMYCIPSHSFSNSIKDLHGNAPLQNCNLS